MYWALYGLFSRTKNPYGHKQIRGHTLNCCMCTCSAQYLLCWTWHWRVFWGWWRRWMMVTLMGFSAQTLEEVTKETWSWECCRFLIRLHSESLTDNWTTWITSIEHVISDELSKNVQKLVGMMITCKIYVLICMGGLPVHSCFCAPILIHMRTGVKKTLWGSMLLMCPVKLSLLAACTLVKVSAT